ncbi:hypothetical protein GYA49_02080 [Candidatus Beckwithbacteria bacterium]|nr:hypothetical protein [Candidatus Beckwithbacteria bacterium]
MVGNFKDYYQAFFVTRRILAGFFVVKTKALKTIWLLGSHQQLALANIKNNRTRL